MTNSLTQRIALGAQAWAAQGTPTTHKRETVRDSKGYLTEVWTINGKIVTPKD